MFKLFCRNFPGPLFTLLNVLIWLLLCTVSAWNNYTRRLDIGEADANFVTIFLDYLPWWMHWGWITPIIVALIGCLPYQAAKRKSLVGINLVMFIITMTVYWLSTIVTVTLIKYGTLSIDEMIGVSAYVFKGAYHFDIIVYVAIVCIGFVRVFDRYVMSEQARNRELAHQLVQTELDALKSQLNPHFLFNTLNSIASLIRQESKNKALTALSELSLMLRKVLENQNSQMVPLAQELEFSRSYLAIQKMRFGDKIDESITLENDCENCEVPFMFMQPLLENAVQHSSQLETDHNPIMISFYCQQNELIFKMQNLHAGQSKHKGFGIGIENSRQRLKRIYGDAFELTLTAENGLFITHLRLPTGD